MSEEGSSGAEGNGADDSGASSAVDPPVEGDGADRRLPFRHVLRIARWEVARSTGTIDAKTAVAFALALALFLAAAPVLLGGSVAVDEGIYRVAIEEDNQYYPAVTNDSALRPVGPDQEADLIVTDDGVFVGDPTSEKSAAARSEFQSAVRDYNNRRLDEEANRSAAFPVVVELRHEDRSVSRTVGGPGDGTAGDGTDDGGTNDDGGATNGDTGGTDGETGGTTGDDQGGDAGTTDGGTDGAGGSDGGGGTGGSDGGDDADGTDGDGTDGAGSDGNDTNDDNVTEDEGVPGVGSGLFGDGQVGTPADIDPPFPFEPLVLAFVFIIPMNFVIQAYGSTIINERLNRRGELLLVSPVSPAAIVVGKTLPYFAALVATTTAIAAGLAVVAGDGGVSSVVSVVSLGGEGGSLLSVLAVVPLALLFLSATFVGGMFARSYKELTFVTVTISVFLTTYAFVPAIFTDVTPIALISPLTLVVRDLQGVGVTVVQYGFSTGPVYLSALVLFGLGLGVYREEDMFTQRSVHLKALDALAAHISRPRHVFAVTLVLIPFVFLLQLLSVAVLFPLERELGLQFVLLFVLTYAAAIEEIAKSLHVFAAYEHGRFERTIPVALLLGFASGAGFFVAEKIVHAGQLVGLDNVELGQAVFRIGLDVDPIVAVGLFFVPLLLHVLTTTIAVLGARAGSIRYVIALGVAIVVHVAYNLGVLLYAL